MKFRIILFSLAILLTGIAMGYAQWNNCGSGVCSVRFTITPYVGLLDQYPSLPITVGWSTWALKKSYADGGGHFALIHRQSDNATTTINFDSSYRADVAAFTSHGCGSSNPCFVDTQYDQSGNGLDETCTNVRIFIATDGRLARAPQAGGKCVTAYSATFATPVQEMFAVGAPMYMDYRPTQAGLPYIQTTGTVTSGSANVTSVASIAGMSANNTFVSNPGLYDSQGCIPQAAGGAVNNAYVTSVAGATIGLGFNPGTASTTCTQAGDTLTFTNAVKGGVWWANGPTASGFTGAYWAYGISIASVDQTPSQTAMRRNGTTFSSNNGSGGNPGEGMRQATAVWDIESQTGTVFYNGTLISTTLASANITYSTNVQLTKYQAPNAADQLQNAVFEQEVIVSTVQTGGNRTSIASWLQSQFGFTPLPTTVTDSNGFTLKPQSLTSYPNYPPSGTSTYGDYAFTDANSITWNPQTGGYGWPAAGCATNVNNSPATLCNFQVHQGDTDVNINNSERSEISSNATLARGGSASFFYQFRFNTYTSQIGDWAYIQQVHYDDATGAAPDIFALLVKSSVIQPVYQVSGSVDINCGSSISLVQGTVYAVQVEITWNPDTIKVWMGTNGGTLTQTCNITPTLPSVGSPAYAKSGIYRGYPYSNAGNLSVDVMNFKWSNTANTYSSLRTTQPALPTHP